jgi:hypothetical protein
VAATIGRRAVSEVAVRSERKAREQPRVTTSRCLAR